MTSKEESKEDCQPEQNPRLKSIDDIKYDLSDIIKKAEEQKANTETGLTQFISDIKQTYTDTTNNVDNANKELDNSKKVLEGIASKKIAESQKYLSESLTRLEKSYEFAKGGYDDLFWPICSLIAGVLLFGAYSIIITIDPRLSYNLFGIPLFLGIPLILFFWGSYKIRESFESTRQKFSQNNKEIVELKKQVTNIDYSIEKQAIKPIQLKDVDPYLVNAISQCKTFVINLGKTLPIVSESFNNLTLLSKYQDIVDNFKASLHYYSIYDNDEYFDLLKVPDAEIKIIDDENHWKKVITIKILNELELNKINVSAPVLLLLYHEHNGDDSSKIYRDICTSEVELETLSSILINSNKLIKPSHNINYKKSDIKAILKVLNDFDLSKLNEKLLEYYELLEIFKKSLLTYNLLVEKSFDNISLDNIQIIDRSDFFEQIIIDKLVIELNKTEIKASNKLVYLLYCSYIGRTTSQIYRDVCDSDKDIYFLSDILLKNNILIESPNNVPHNINEIITLLKSLNDFDIQEINKKLSNILNELDYINSYNDFLAKNGIDPQPIDFKFIIQNDHGNQDFGQRIIDLCYIVGKGAFNNIIFKDYEHFRDGFIKASISLKFHDNYSIRNYACKISAIDESVAVIKAYYEKMEEHDRKSLVTIKEIIDDIELVTTQYNKREEQDFIFLKGLLLDGQWSDSSSAIIKEFLEKHATEMKDQLSKIEKFTILQEVFREHFRKVSINTVDKAIDAQLFSAYIIMFHTTKGKLKDAIDRLSFRYLEANYSEEKMWEPKPPDVRQNIIDTYGVVPRYDFIHFSDSTRLGYLKKGTKFSDFKKAFLRDLNKVMEIDHDIYNEEFDVGVVIHRIMPSRYSLGILEENDESIGFLTVKNLDLARDISRLASYYIPAEEQASILKLESDVDLLEFINHKTIYEIIRIENDDLDEKEKKILKTEDLKTQLLQNVKEKYRINSIKSLAIEINKKRIERKEIDKLLSNFLYVYFTSQEGTKRYSKPRADLLSRRFLDALNGLILIYELQKK